MSTEHRQLRLFVAVWAPADVVAAIAAVARPATRGLRWTTEDQWHVTLRFLGTADVEDAVARLAAVDAPRAIATMGPLTGRFGTRILHTPVTGLDEVASAVEREFGPGDKPFRGHLTLARARHRRGIDLRPLTGRPLSGEWPVEAITLVASHVHPQGARYEVLARRPLA